APPSLPIAGVDRAHLERARRLRLRGRGSTRPNPMVGCVIVAENRTVGRGWHTNAGGAHAEVVALGEAGEAARGATAYISLEPCAHFGRTPPCTAALLDAGVTRVVYGAADPGGESAGGGAALAAAGIDVTGPCLTSHAALVDNPAFFHRARTGRLHVAAKLATGLDGRIAARVGERTPVTGEAAVAEVHRMRAEYDAIAVGATTARVDDPLLTVRGEIVPPTPPVRIVLDADAGLSLESSLVATLDEAPVWLFCSEDADESRVEVIERAGVSVHPVPGRDTSDGERRLDLAAVLSVASDLGVTSLLVEGGGRLVDAFAGAKLLDRLHLFVAPRVFGPAGVPAFPGDGIGEGWRQLEDPRRFGDDLRVTWDRIEGLD
ncbi:MAG: bifunctional diaminohydroxyphosphoribosylaminopyrimidine deaminase/5-amino-6-(5-phosphoribosylamino)uracil reductase RibD, partial [Longimicrobiales bacterium]|nr:bifunctional diaminohydroxyphosphoribosylaminopyrimidine deaminase/5-amino-6-(5-phosphoribosylamino)uracil reductase RibD [Longimicrobiales bacterium]